MTFFSVHDPPPLQPKRVRRIGTEKMTTRSSPLELDLESQQIRLTTSATPPPRRRRWRLVFLLLQATQILVSIANKPKKGRLPLPGSVPLSSSRVAYREVGTSHFQEILEPATIQASIPSNTDENDGQAARNAKLQHESICKIIEEKDLHSLHQFGGVQGLAEALDTDLEDGIPGNEDDLLCRFMDSRPTASEPPPQSFSHFLLKACNNYVVFLLLLSTTLSLFLGIKREGMDTGWYEGAIMLNAVIILVFLSAIRDYWLQSSQEEGKRRLFDTEERMIEVVRGSIKHQISASNALRGDIVCLHKGHQVPADGLLVSGELEALDDGLRGIANDQNPFLIHGSRVLNGNGRMLVTSVGEITVWGQMMSRISKVEKPLVEAQLDKVSTWAQIAALLVSILILVALILRQVLAKEENNSGLAEVRGKPISVRDLAEAIQTAIIKPKGKISILTTMLAMFLVGIAEGLPFSLALAITCWNKKILGRNAFANQSSACISMGLVTAIVTDATGGLTLNPLEIEMCCIGEETMSEDSVIATHVQEKLCDGICMPFLVSQCPCTPVENQLLSWATTNLGLNLETLKQSSKVIDSRKLEVTDERHGVLIRKNVGNGSMHVHWKGPATTILDMCSSYYDCRGNTNNMDAQKRIEFEERMQSENLQTIAFAYKPIDAPNLEEKNLTLLGMVSLKKTCYEEIRLVMEAYREAGIHLKLVSNLDVTLVEAIAREGGILLPDSDAIVVDADTFRRWTDGERKEKVEKICVMGKARPSDRLCLVKCLKENEHRVAVVGLRKSEIPAMKEADVGVVMGIQSTKMVRDSSDILILDGQFTFLKKMSIYGRCIYGSIQKYIQLELTMFVAGLLTTFITAAASGNSPITSIQLFWVNLVVTALGGLALLTEVPTENQIQKLPVGRTRKLITNAMWRSIMTQSLYQIAILVTFHFKGQALLEINEKVSNTIVFNSYALCQVFNQLNTRKPEMKNPFHGICQNAFSWIALLLIVGLQEAFMEIAHIVSGDAILSWKNHGVCFLIGVLTLVVDLVVKWIASSVMHLWNRLPSSSPSELASNLELPPIINGAQGSASNLDLPSISTEPSESTDQIELPLVSCRPNTASS